MWSMQWFLLKNHSFLTFKNPQYESNLVNKSQIDNDFFGIKNEDFLGNTPKLRFSSTLKKLLLRAKVLEKQLLSIFRITINT